MPSSATFSSTATCISTPPRKETSIETGLPVYNVVEVRSQPGAAGTILNNLVALGIGEVFAVGFCGDDGEGYELRQALASRAGVNLENFLTARLAPNSSLLQAPGHRARPSAARIEPSRFQELDARLPTGSKRELACRVVEVANRVDAIILLDQVDLPETGVVTRAREGGRRRRAAGQSGLIVLADSRQGLRRLSSHGVQDECRRARPDGGRLDRRHRCRRAACR